MPETPPAPTPQAPTGNEPPQSIKQSPTSSGPASSAPKSKTRFTLSKRILSLIIAFLILAVGGAAAYFGFIEPNKPENVWGRALKNTGKGYDRLTNYVASEADYEKGVKANGSFKVTIPGRVVEGEFKGSADENNNGQLTGSLASSGLRVNFDLRSIASSSSNPDIYFKVDGIQGIQQILGTSNPIAGTALEKLNGQWYFIDHTLFDQYTENSDSQEQSISKKDIEEFLKAIGEPSKKYIFTNERENMALEIRQYVGKEKVDGRDAYHYKVGINKQKLKAWNKEACDKSLDTKVYKLLSFGRPDDELRRECYDTKDIDEIDSSQTADVWVDTNSKFIYKIRFTEKNKPDNFMDIVMDYKGGDKVPFKFVFHSKDSRRTTDGTIGIEVDMKKDTIKVSANVKETGSEDSSGSFNMTIEPNKSAVKAEKPENAKTILELYNDLGLEGLFGSPGAYNPSTTTAPQLQ